MYFYEFENPDNPSKDEVRETLNLARTKQKNLEYELHSKPTFGELMTRKEKAELGGLNEDLKKIESDIAELEIMLSKLKHFRKDYFISNFKRLTAMKKVKIGDIETEALLTPGYLSRLDKDGNVTDPNIEFVVTAADMLGVTVDELIRGDIAELTETEQFILNFLNKLIKDTREDSINWLTEKSQEQFNSFMPDEKWDSIFRDMYDVKKSAGNLTVTYKSQYSEKVHLSKELKSCRVNLGDNTDEVIMMACRDASHTMDYFEFYLKSPKHIVPLFNSAISRDVIKEKTSDLYEEIMKSEKRIHLSQPAVDMIKNYMNK